MHSMPSPTADFYNPLTRAWELLAGAALCTAMRHPSAHRLSLKLDPGGRGLSLALAVLGILLLGCSLWLVRDNWAYPGWQALLPVLGTVFLLAAGPLNPVSKNLLANRPSVFVGLVSYPLYLWHWVLFSYAYITFQGKLETETWLLRGGLVAASLVLAILTYFLVEKPIRFGTRARRGKIYALIAGMVIMGSLGGLVLRRHGFPARVGVRPAGEILPYTEWSEERSISLVCQRRFPVSLRRHPDQDNYCVIANDAPPTAALLGDSIANAYFPGFAAELRAHGENLVQIGCAGCPPLLDIASGPEGQNDWCDGLTSDAIRTVAVMPSVHTVFLSADWSLYVKGTRLTADSSTVDNSWKISHLPPEKPGESNTDVLREQLKKTIRFLVDSGKNVVIVKQPPALSFNPVDCLTKRPITFLQKTTCSMSAEDEKKYFQEYEDIFKSILVDYPNVKVLDPFDIFFSDGQPCIISKNTLPLFRDRTPHLSYYGSLVVAHELFKNQYYTIMYN